MKEQTLKLLKMQNSKIHYILETKSLELRPYCKKYVKEYNSWFEKYQQLLYLTGSQPLTYEQELQNHQSWLTDPKKYTFLVFAKEDSKLIGDVNLFFSDWIEPNEAQINIMIAVKQYRGKGYAKEIMEIIEAFALGIYDKNEIIAKIKDDNKASIRFFQKIGYTFINHNKHHEQVEYRKKIEIGNKQQVLQTLKDQYKLNVQSNVEELFSL